MVLAKFNAHFIPTVNVIHKRAKFHRRVQQPGENVETYIRSLYDLASTCGFEAAHKNTHIRDQLVVGISDKRTSEKLQLQEDAIEIYCSQVISSTVKNCVLSKTR